MKEISEIEPREYQKSIFETAKEANTLVVLPTGVGKTLIALMLSIERQKKHPGQKTLILAPTRPLVEQHFKTFKENLPELFADIQLFTGSVAAPQRKKIWQTADIIFSTPQCIANDLEHRLYDLKEIALLIIDEAHRCLKNYDYNNVVKFYKQQGTNQLILGLTASPGADADTVRQICSNLAIQNIEVRTRDSPDVKPYLQEFPKPPHGEGVGSRMAENGGEEIAGVAGLALLVVGGQIELGDLDRLAEFGKAVKDAHDCCRGGDGVAEVALHADDVGSLALVDQVLNPPGIVILLGLSQTAVGEYGVLVDGHSRVWGMLAGDLEPFHHGIPAQ